VPTMKATSKKKKMVPYNMIKMWIETRKKVKSRVTKNIADLNQGS